LFICAAGALLAASVGTAELRAEESTVGRIEISLRLQPDASGGPGSVFLDVLLVNDSTSILFFAEQSPDWDYRLDITRPDGSPLRLTNYGCHVIPQPVEIMRNIARQLAPGAKDHVESVELNRLYVLDRIGRYRVVARRRVWRVKPAYATQPYEFLSKCRTFADCYDLGEATSAPFSFDLSVTYPDVSPPANRRGCPVAERK
jgi:hypothetical protein